MQAHTCGFICQLLQNVVKKNVLVVDNCGPEYGPNVLLLHGLRLFVSRNTWQLTAIYTRQQLQILISF
jgi:hypothetical protein